MVERTELIIICRQIGGMMEAGIDILRIIRVLQVQTENPRLLEVYERLGHDLRMGSQVSDALARAPDLFSPFAISLIRQGEERNNIAGAFFKVADFLQKDEEVLHHLQMQSTASAVAASGLIPVAAGDETASPPAAGNAAQDQSLRVVAQAVESALAQLQAMLWRGLAILSGLLFCLAGMWWVVEVGMLPRRLLGVALATMAAWYLAGAALWLQRRGERDRIRASVSTSAHSTDSEEVQSLPAAPTAPDVIEAVSQDNIAQAAGTNGRAPGSTSSRSSTENETIHPYNSHQAASRREATFE